MKHTKNTGFSIILAMGVMILLSLIGLYLMEYMVPFSRNIKGIENASQAFYESYAGVEDNVLRVYSGSLGANYNEPFAPNTPQDYEFNFVGSGRDIPISGEGNSQDTDYSRFSQSEPISLDIGNGRFGTTPSETIDLYLKIPNGVDFQAPTSDEIILVQLSGNGGSLSSASGALIRKSQVNNSSINLFDLDGETLTGIDRTFLEYYGDIGCDTAGVDCVLKLSVIRPLVSSTLNGNATIPYLEYRIDSSEPIPYPNPLMVSQGKSYGFSKTLEVFIPQEATSSAFDFTVLQ